MTPTPKLRFVGGQCGDDTGHHPTDQGQCQRQFVAQTILRIAKNHGTGKGRSVQNKNQHHGFLGLEPNDLFGGTEERGAGFVFDKNCVTKTAEQIFEEEECLCKWHNVQGLPFQRCVEECRREAPPYYESLQVILSRSCTGPSNSSVQCFFLLAEL